MKFKRAQWYTTIYSLVKESFWERISFYHLVHHFFAAQKTPRFLRRPWLKHFKTCTWLFSTSLFICSLLISPTFPLKTSAAPQPTVWGFLESRFWNQCTLQQCKMDWDEASSLACTGDINIKSTRTNNSHSVWKYKMTITITYFCCTSSCCFCFYFLLLIQQVYFILLFLLEADICLKTFPCVNICITEQHSYFSWFLSSAV